MEIEINKNLLILLVVVPLALVGFFLFKGKTGSAVLAYDEVVKIPLSEISGTAKFYDYDSSGVNIKYFAVKASDGSIKTAFDACDVCYRSRKGYRQEGNDMVCNNCGNRYAISGLGTKNLKGGGCWPGYLPSKIDGDYLIVGEKDLESGRYTVSPKVKNQGKVYY